MTKKTALFFLLLFGLLTMGAGVIIVTKVFPPKNVFPKSAGVSHSLMPSAFTSYEGMDSGWSDQYGNGTVGFDPFDFVGGTASIRIRAAGNASLAGMRKQISGGNWSSGVFRIWVKADNWNNVADASLVFSTSGAFDSFFSCNVRSQLTSPANNEWLEVVLSRDKFIPVGLPDWTTVNDMIVRAIGVKGQAPVVHFDEFGAAPAGSRSFVSVAFDDGWSSAYTQGKKKMDAYGFRGNYFVIPKLIGTPRYITQAQVDEAHRQGWEISGHGQTDLTTLSVPQIDAELEGVRLWLAQKGYRGQDIYAYPGGKHNGIIAAELIKYFSFARALAWGSNGTSMFTGISASARTVTNTDSVAGIEILIDNALNSRSWLILVFHKLVPSPTIPTEYSISDFGAIIDYLQTKAVTDGLGVLPIEQALGRLTP